MTQPYDLNQSSTVLDSIPDATNEERRAARRRLEREAPDLLPMLGREV